MAVYKCKVFSSSGEKLVFKVEGFSEDDILADLRKNNFIIADIRKHSRLFEDRRMHITAKIKAKELSLLCRQLNSMLRSGISIVKCIDILSMQAENQNFRSVLVKIYRELLTGSTFSEAVQCCSELFPPMFVSMVKAAELSGNLEKVMGRMSVHYSREHKIESKVKSALTYPAVLAVVSTFVVIFLLVNVMPTFVDLYQSSGVALPLTTRVMLKLSSFLQIAWKYAAVTIIFGVFAAARLFKDKNIRLRIDRFKLGIPLYRTLKIKLAASRFARTLSTLIESGVSLLSGLEAVSTVVGNEYISNHILNAREDVRKGSSLSCSIRDNNIFPPMVYSMIKIGEEAGQLEEVLDKTADFFDDEVENAIQKLIALIEPVMIVAMAAIVGFIMLAMLSPMFEMINTFQ